MVLFVLLGAVRMKAWLASLITLAVAIVVALAVYSMPVGQAADSALEGAVFGFWPIMWIVINALWIYNMSDVTGYFAVLRRAFSMLSDDLRVQVVVIAFCFGALLEALAGFGTPPAICGIMLVGIGVSPLRAASVALVADTAPVAFGAIAIPITTLAQVTGLPVHHLSQMVGRQTPFLALLIPFVLVFMVDGRRGLRESWPAALTAGVASRGRAVRHLQLRLDTAHRHRRLARVRRRPLDATARVVAPGLGRRGCRRSVRSRPSPAARPPIPHWSGASAPSRGEPPSRRDLFLAFSPYLIIIVVLGVTSLHGINVQLDKLTERVQVARTARREREGQGAPPARSSSSNWLTAAGTWLLVSGVLTAVVLRVRPGQALRVYAHTLNQIKWAIFTVCTVLALAYVMNLSGQTITLGTWAAGAGGFFAFLSPLIGWFGTAVTGSDTSTNSLFGALQVAAAHKASLSPTLLAAANSSGGVLAKMVSPQNLAIGASAVGLAGRGGRHLPPSGRLEPPARAADGRAGAASVGRAVVHGALRAQDAFSPDTRRPADEGGAAVSARPICRRL